MSNEHTNPTDPTVPKMLSASTPEELDAMLAAVREAQSSPPAASGANLWLTEAMVSAINSCHATLDAKRREIFAALPPLVLASDFEKLARVLLSSDEAHRELERAHWRDEIAKIRDLCGEESCKWGEGSVERVRGVIEERDTLRARVAELEREKSDLRQELVLAQDTVSRMEDNALRERQRPQPSVPSAGEAIEAPRYGRAFQGITESPGFGITERPAPVAAEGELTDEECEQLVPFLNRMLSPYGKVRYIIARYNALRPPRSAPAAGREPTVEEACDLRDAMEHAWTFRYDGDDDIGAHRVLLSHLRKWSAEPARRVETGTITASGATFTTAPKEPAPPAQRGEPDETLRDRFAMAALSGMTGDPQRNGTHAVFAKDAYLFANAMLAQREASAGERT